MNEQQNIWFPSEDLYRSREGDYAKLANEFSEQNLVELVQTRAKEDGTWLIENGFVGEQNVHEKKMRRMMAWVSEPRNIIQCHKANDDGTKTVDWICRELAQATHRIFEKWTDG